MNVSVRNEKRLKRSGRREVSLVSDQHAMFALGRVTETRENVRVGEVWKITKYLVLAHASREIRENVIDRDAHAANTWLPAALAWLDHDDAFVSHPMILDR